jgi:hypothetical protein
MSPEHSSSPEPPVAGCRPGDRERTPGLHLARDVRVIERALAFK